MCLDNACNAQGMRMVLLWSAWCTGTVRDSVPAVLVAMLFSDTTTDTDDIADNKCCEQ